MQERQRTRLLLTALMAGVILSGITGCQSGMPSRKTMAANEPPLSGSGGSGFIAEKPAAGSTAFVDRHPLFYKPKEYYETSGNNTFVKVAGATLVGIPVGLYGELRQIVTGSPTKTY